MNIKNYFLLYFKGIAMGLADAIPGVSGGTIAFISGIYEELIYSIRSFNIEAFRLLIELKIKRFWLHINGTFLLVLFSGIISAILLMLRIILYCLKYYPEILWSFFFGLIIASAIIIITKISKFNKYILLYSILGLLIGLLLSNAIPKETTSALWFIFLSGAIAICAMILPGISGSFILVLLGKYEFILQSVKSFKFDIIILFVLGAITGLLLFSHFLNWMLKNFYDYCIALLTGIMIGSLVKVWPWKYTIKTYLDSHGNIKPLIQENVLPWNYYNLTNNDPYFWTSLLFALTGFIIVYSIYSYNNKKMD